MLGVLADDANYTTAMNHLALVTDLLYGCADLHCNSLLVRCLAKAMQAWSAIQHGTKPWL
jgi:hypothetical protein